MMFRYSYHFATTHNANSLSQQIFNFKDKIKNIKYNA